MSMRLYVGNIGFQTSEDELQTLFSEAGTVNSVTISVDSSTGRSRGFGFVEMSSPEEGEAAIQYFDGSPLNGRNLIVTKPRES